MSVDKVRAHLLRLRNEGAYAALGQAAETFGSDDMAEERWTSRQVAIFLSHLQRQYAPTGALTFETVLDEVLNVVGPPPGWAPPGTAEAPEAP